MCVACFVAGKFHLLDLHGYLDNIINASKMMKGMDCVTNDILEKGVDDGMTAKRGEWKKMTCCAVPK